MRININISYKWASQNCFYCEVKLQEVHYAFFGLYKKYNTIKVYEYSSISYALEKLEEITKDYEVYNVYIDNRIP